MNRDENLQAIRKAMAVRVAMRTSEQERALDYLNKIKQKYVGMAWRIAKARLDDVKEQIRRESTPHLRAAKVQIQTDFDLIDLLRRRSPELWFPQNIEALVSISGHSDFMKNDMLKALKTLKG